jgi:heme-degrading monooxygenase HmoA
MIARLWHGYTKPENADAYQQLLIEKILPGIHRVKGYQGCQLLRQNGESEVEFITVTMWDSFDSIREFAGEDYQHGVVPIEARKLLERFDESSTHYESIWCP